MIENLKVRLYAEEDHKEITRWNLTMGTIVPAKDLLTEDSTFILEWNEVPWICVTVYQMPVKAFAWVEHLSSNPSLLDGKEREMAVGYLQEYLEGWARAKGYKALWCMAAHPKLAERFEALGYRETGSGIKTFLKGL